MLSASSFRDAKKKQNDLDIIINQINEITAALMDSSLPLSILKCLLSVVV